MFNLIEGDVTLYDAVGNPIDVINDSGVYRLATSAKLRNIAGSQVNPATQDTLATVDSKLGAIKDTDGIKKITDALPAGSNEIGRIRGYLYDDVNNVALPVVPDATVPTNTRALLWAGQGADDKAYIPRVDNNGKVSVAPSPPTAPPGTSAFTVDASSPLEVGPSPVYEDTNGPIIPSDTDVHIQYIAGGAAGDPSEKGSKIEVYWEEGAGPTRHLIERIYLSGATVAVTLPNTGAARDGTAMIGNNVNTRIVVRRERLSTSAQEIDAVVRGYTEAS